MKKRIGDIVKKHGVILFSIILIMTMTIGAMTGCGKAETEPESLAEKVSGQNTEEDVLPNTNVGEEETLSTSAGEEETLSTSAGAAEAEDISGQSAETVNDTSDMAAATEPGSWYGSYIIKDYIIRGVTAIGNEEAKGLMMCLLEYGPDEFNSDGILLEAPAYRETLVGREEFAAMYSGSGGGCTFETFGIEGDSLLEVTIDNSFELGNTFYVWDENRILVHHPGGAFLVGVHESAAGQDPIDGVTMEITEVSDISVTVTITNNTDKEIQCGESFHLEMQDTETSEWQELDIVIDNYAFQYVAYRIQDHSTFNQDINLDWLYGKLKPGKYRIVKDITDFRGTGDYTDYIYTAEFDVD